MCVFVCVTECVNVADDKSEKSKSKCCVDLSKNPYSHIKIQNAIESGSGGLNIELKRDDLCYLMCVCSELRVELNWMQKEKKDACCILSLDYCCPYTRTHLEWMRCVQPIFELWSWTNGQRQHVCYCYILTTDNLNDLIK